MKRVFISTTSFATYSRAPLKLLEKNNFHIELNKTGRKLTSHEVPLYLKPYDAVIAGTETYSEKTLKLLPNLKVISRLGVGLDNIDMKSAKKLKISIYKTKTIPALAVAELTLGLMLDLLRKISYQYNLIKSGIWKKNMGELLSGKTLGIIGLGAIGKKLVEITTGFNLQYLAYDIQKDEVFTENYGVQYTDMEKLLRNADIISIHLNLSAQTNYLIDYNAFKMMKKSAIIINTSRGEIIDEKSLIKALDEKLIQGAGLDVFEKEPYNGLLTDYNNVIITPHVGAYAKEIRTKMELESAQNLIKSLKNE